ncbi:LysM peptidoglycan-binding domain-containing protein [Bradyrhizobium sp. RDT10]
MAYRPATLKGVASALVGLTEADVGLLAPELKEGDFSLHDVRTGDTLSDIAKDKYGAGKFWRLVFEANRDKLDHPDRIYVGQVLRIPNKPPAEDAANV